MLSLVLKLSREALTRKLAVIHNLSESLLPVNISPNLASPPDATVASPTNSTNIRIQLKRGCGARPI